MSKKKNKNKKQKTHHGQKQDFKKKPRQEKVRENAYVSEKVNLDLNPDHLYFLPLGGAEQFGVNLNVYAHDGKFLVVDCGIGFADEQHPGVDILLPDPSFLAEHRKDIAALVVTHAHEDHVGAIPYLWPRLKCPVYCSEFTAAVLQRKFNEHPECRDAEITIIDPGSNTQIGPYNLHFIHVSHSIPDTCSLVIETPVGRVLHSGDWNLDPKPVLNLPTDEKSFRKFGEKGILAYIGDSTNAEVPGRGKSESEVEKGLSSLFAECRGRIMITIFASNIARVSSIVKAARENGRDIALVGRSLHTMTGAALDCGYLKGDVDFVDEDDINSLEPEKTVLIVTGSQGEARAALARIASGEHRNVKLNRGDTVIFSSRAIPGNEMEINEVRNNLAATGVTVITPNDTEHVIHASGHPYQDEIRDMLQWTKPQIVIPVHGGRTQLEAHAALARQSQVKNVIVPMNGAVINLAPGKPEIVDHIPVGLLAVEPNRIISADHIAIAERRKLQFSGTAHVTLVLDDRGDLVTDPQITLAGLIDEEDEQDQRFKKEIGLEIEDILADMDRGDLKDDHAVHEEIRIGVRRFVDMVLGLKPATSVHIVRV